MEIVVVADRQSAAFCCAHIEKSFASYCQVPSSRNAHRSNHCFGVNVGPFQFALFSDKLLEESGNLGRVLRLTDSSLESRGCRAKPASDIRKHSSGPDDKNGQYNKGRPNQEQYERRKVKGPWGLLREHIFAGEIRQRNRVRSCCGRLLNV